MIGQILRRMRKERNMTQGELAKKISMPQNTLSQYETGSIQPTFETIEKIANACKFNIMFSDKSGYTLTSKNINREEI